jgi:hypothetical protein
VFAGTTSMLPARACLPAGVGHGIARLTDEQLLPPLMFMRGYSMVCMCIKGAASQAQCREQHAGLILALPAGREAVRS